jgi:hypothetical protein
LGPIGVGAFVGVGEDDLVDEGNTAVTDGGKEVLEGVVTRICVVGEEPLDTDVVACPDDGDWHPTRARLNITKIQANTRNRLCLFMTSPSFTFTFDKDFKYCTSYPAFSSKRLVDNRLVISLLFQH